MSFTMFTLEQEGQKSGGAMPPQSEKWRGHWPPCSAAYGLWFVVTSDHVSVGLAVL